MLQGNDHKNRSRSAFEPRFLGMKGEVVFQLFLRLRERAMKRILRGRRPTRERPPGGGRGGAGGGGGDGHGFCCVRASVLF